MMKDVKSRVGSVINDVSWRKHRDDLHQFKREHQNSIASGQYNKGTSNRHIDKKNLDLFVRLSSVQPHVPVVVKRKSLLQKTLSKIDLKPNDDENSDQETNFNMPSLVVKENEDGVVVDTEQLGIKVQSNKSYTNLPLASDSALLSQVGG